MTLAVMGSLHDFSPTCFFSIPVTVRVTKPVSVNGDVNGRKKENHKF